MFWRCSSAVEQGSHKPWVGSSNLPAATRSLCLNYLGPAGVRVGIGDTVGVGHGFFGSRGSSGVQGVGSGVGVATGLSAIRITPFRLLPNIIDTPMNKYATEAITIMPMVVRERMFVFTIEFILSQHLNGISFRYTFTIRNFGSSLNRRF
jgi:hypothetical protein